MTAEHRFLGIDVGATTLKLALEDEGGTLIAQDQDRHGGRAADELEARLARFEAQHGVTPGDTRVFVTGSGGLALAPLVGARFVHEVTAVTALVERRFPDVGTIIDLGGQHAAIVVFKRDRAGGSGRKVASMNDKCAGGTGAVIDKIAQKLGVGERELADLAYDGVRLHNVAGKCGVFAETDINSLQKMGIGPSELMASLIDAIVTQNLGVLARGQTLFPPVLLVGGPASRIRAVGEAWRHHLAAHWREREVSVPAGAGAASLVRVPDMAGLMGALGAIAWGRREADASSVYAGRRALIDYLGAGRQAEKRRSTLPGLVASKAELDEFTARYGRPAFTPPTVAPGTRLRCAVGVDGGSTSTKAVLLAEDGELLGSAYHLSKGHPIEDTVAIFEALRAPVERQGASLDVVAVGTTGYAKDLVGSAIGADVALVETVAHVKAALRWYDAPDVIADVGGQDIKLMFLRDGLVADFRLNTQCSAGNGYYLQATSHSYGIPVEQYADVAFTARDMPQFGHGCAVFMQSDIVACQRLGWSPPEILAGLAAVLPRNVWLYVARMPNLPRLGTRFLLQGGTQNNLAAVKAQVDFIRSRFEGTGREPDVIVHRHAGEAGAIGAALEALDGWRQGRRSGFIGLDAVASLRSRTTRDERTRCRFCTNRCMRTFIDLHVGLAASPQTSRPESSVPLLPGERRVIVAGCDDGTVEQAHELRAARASAGVALRESPNLVAWAAEAVWRSWEPRRVPMPRIGRLAGPGARLRAARAARRGRLRIGMPRVLNMYAYAPLFGGYLESLGVRREAIVYSAVTTEGLFRRGAGRGAIDPCFPAKLALAHVHDLLTVQHEAGRLDAIFFPMFDSLRTPIVATLAADPCPTVTLTPATVKAAFVRARDEFALAGIRYLAPLVSVGERRRFEHQMFEAWGPVLGLTREESDAAVGEGFDALDRYESELRRRARAALDRLAEERGVGIVMLGRAYHHDPGVNHGILEELQRRGYAIFSQSTLPMDADWLDELFGDEVRGGLITHALAIDDVWGASYSANTNEKIWAAKVTARHPNLVALEVSSFKCGLDAPVYTLVEEILGASGTPYFAFKDIDENRPSGSIKLRVETIDYFLSRYRERLRREGVPRQVSALAGTS